jgi:hypothetical protein
MPLKSKERAREDLHPVGGPYTGRFIRAEAESRGRELGDEGDEGDASVPTLPLIHPRPYGNELPCPVQDKPTCVR